MPEALAILVVHALAIYLGAGLIFALAFALLGVGRIDPAAKTAGPGFRLVILPGVTVLWPLLAWRWLRGHGEPPEECSPHILASRRAK